MLGPTVRARPRFRSEGREAAMQTRRPFMEADQYFAADACRTAIASIHGTGLENDGCPLSNMSIVGGNKGIQVSRSRAAPRGLADRWSSKATHPPR